MTALDDCNTDRREVNPRGRDELTRDPIFLLQRRSLLLVQEPLGWMTDADGDLVPEWSLDGKADREHGPTKKDWPCADWPDEDEGPGGVPILRVRALFDWSGSEYVYEHWETERVFITREEGQAYGERRHYNYRDGFRVYCVCCEGGLAALLKRYDSGEIQ